MNIKTTEKTLLTIKTDKNLKKAAQKTAEELGIPLGTFVNMTLRQFVRDKKIDFSISKPNSKTSRILFQSEKEFAKGAFEGPYTTKQLAKKWRLD